jgi:hypothetical protein
VPQDAAIEFFGFADSDVNYGSDLMFISIIPMGCWNSSGAGGIHIRSWLSRAFTNGTVPLGRRMRHMIALKTSASSGLIQQQPLGVGLRRRDLQQRHQFAGAGQAESNEAVMGAFKQFLDADSVVPQHLDDRPSSKRMLLGPIQQYQLAGVGVASPDIAGKRVGPIDPGEGPSATVNDCPSGFC